MESPTPDFRRIERVLFSGGVRGIRIESEFQIGVDWRRQRSGSQYPVCGYDDETIWQDAERGAVDQLADFSGLLRAPTGAQLLIRGLFVVCSEASTSTNHC